MQLARYFFSLSWSMVTCIYLAAGHANSANLRSIKRQKVPIPWHRLGCFRRGTHRGAFTTEQGRGVIGRTQFRQHHEQKTTTVNGLRP